MRVQLHIGRLVLDGVAVAPHERHLFKAAVQQELARLIEEGQTDLATVTTAWESSRDAGTIGLEPSTGVQEMGVRTAGAVYRSLGS